MDDTERIKSFFNKLEEYKVSYVWIHSYDNVKEENDIDIAIDKNSFQRIDSIILSISNELSLKVIQLLQHESHAKYFVIIGLDKEYFFLKIDPCTDFMRDGRILLSAEEILNGRIARENYYIPRPEIEAIYILLKKILKGFLTEYHKSKLHDLFSKNKKVINLKINEYFGERYGAILIDALEKNNWLEVENKLIELKKNVLWKSFQKSPFKVFKYWYNEVFRIISRISKPTGLVVILVGPDGAGKSTLSANLLPIMQNTFRKTSLQHWRPGLLPKIANIFGTEKNHDATDPHKMQVQNKFISIIKLIYYWFDYLLGYFFIIYPKKVKSTFVLFDRYYYDYYFDPKRFRISTSKHVIKYFISILPKPDLILVLNAEPIEIYERKQELSVNEITSQLVTINRYFSSRDNCKFVKASDGIETMVDQSLKAIFDFMHSRFIKRYIN